MAARSGTLKSLTSIAGAKPGLALALVLVAGAAAAAVAITYTTPSTVTTGVAAVPVQLVAGADAGPSALSDYVTAYAISTNKTYFTTTVKGVPEATLAIDSYVQLSNVDDASHSVTLSTAQVSNAYVTTYTIQIFNGSNVSQGTLTLTNASPSLTWTIPASTTHRAKLTLTLASGAGANNVALTNSLTLGVA